MAEQNISKLDYTTTEINGGISGGLAYSEEKNIYSKKSEVEEIYAKKSELNNFLRQTDAEGIYATKNEINNLDNVYLKQVDAENTYAKITDLPEDNSAQFIKILEQNNNMHLWELDDGLGRMTSTVISLNQKLFYVTATFIILSNNQMFPTNSWFRIGSLTITNEHTPEDNFALLVLVENLNNEQEEANVKLKVVDNIIYLYSDINIAGRTIQFSGFYHGNLDQQSSSSTDELEDYDLLEF